MMVTFHYSASAVGTLAVLLAIVLSFLANLLNGIASAQCVECQLLLSQHAAPQSPGIFFIIIIILICSLLCLAYLHDAMLV